MFNSLPVFSGGEYWEQFPAGNCAMMVALDGNVRAYVTSQLHEKFAWNMAYLPYAPGEEPYTFGWGNILGINSNTKELEAAWTFLKFYYTEGDPILAKYLAYPNTMNRKTLEIFRTLGPSMGHPTLDLSPIFDPAPRVHLNVAGLGLPASTDVLAILQDGVRKVVSGGSPSILTDAAARATVVLQKRARELGLLK